MHVAAQKLIALIALGFMSCNGIEKDELNSGFVEVDGGKIYYETEGHGDAIVLLHPGSRAWFFTKLAYG